MVTIISVIMLSFLLYSIHMSEQHRRFNAYLAPGDKVRFKAGGHVFNGKVKLIGRKYIHILANDDYGRYSIYKVPFKHVFPCLWFNYYKHRHNHG